MDREMKQYLKWWGITALAVALASMFGCSPPVVTAPEPKVLLAPYRVIYHDSLPIAGQAVTDCDNVGTPTIHILAATAYSGDLPEVMVHELTHVRQMYRSGIPCKDYLAKYVRDAEFRLDIEAEAYCTALGMKGLVGEAWRGYLPNITAFLLANYRLEMETSHVIDRLVVFCSPLFKGG